MTVLYNELEPYAVDWLKNLSDAGHIARGVVDPRSICDLKVEDVKGFKQAHYFAGIGVWSYALKLAGFPDEAEVWTGSPPCQGFSQAGRRKGFEDERHLWPEFFRLIKECRPPIVFLEQVSSKDGLAWLDLVQTDLEGAGYTVWAIDTCAAGVGAPHIRQRLYIVAVTDGERLERVRVLLRERRSQQAVLEVGGCCEAVELADTKLDKRGQVGPHTRGCGGGSEEEGLEQRPMYSGARNAADAERDRSRSRRDGDSPGRPEVESDRHGAACDTLANSCSEGLEVVGEQSARSECAPAERSGTSVELAHPSSEQLDGCGNPRRWRGEPADGGAPRATGARRIADQSFAPGAVNGFWSPAEWIHCRPEPGYPQGRWRPVEPGIEPLAHGVAGRVGKLRAFGNCIVAPLAAEFIGAVIDVLTDSDLVSGLTE